MPVYDVGICLIYVLVYDLAYVFGIYNFYDVAICTPVYGCKYCNELCYKAPLCGMGVMLLRYHVVML